MIVARRVAASQVAGQAGGEPDESPHTEEATEPVDPAHRLLPRPYAEAEGEDRAADIVCSATNRGGEPPPREG